jgi:hypothetical protein
MLSIPFSTKRVFKQGTTQLPSVDLPSGFNELQVFVDRTGWLDVTTKLAIDSELSLDNGVTWEPAGGFSAFGGVDHDRHGNVITVSGFDVPLAHPESTIRKLRATVTVIGSVDTNVTVNLLP